MQSPIIKGIVSLFWGTDGLLPTANATVVQSINIRPVTVDVEIDSNAGSTGAEVLLDNGFDATAKYLYDGNLTQPALGATVGLRIPSQATGATQSAMTTALAAATTYKCLVVKPPIYNIDAERKKESYVTLELKYRPDLGLT